MKIGIGFAILNNFPGAIDTINSVKTNHEYMVRAYRQDQRQISLAAAWNHLIDEVFEWGGDYALICNDDILFAPECIDNMVAEYERLKGEGIIMVTPNNIMGQLADPQDILYYKIPEGIEFSFADHPNFSCFLVGRNFFELHGRFDENFFPAWWEDNDSHYRSILLGLREITTTAAPMVHFGGVSTSMIDNPNSAQSHAYYVKKWGSANRDGDELFKTPYGIPGYSPKDWTPNA